MLDMRDLAVGGPYEKRIVIFIRRDRMNVFFWIFLTRILGVYDFDEFASWFKEQQNKLRLLRLRKEVLPDDSHRGELAVYCGLYNSH